MLLQTNTESSSGGCPTLLSAPLASLGFSIASLLNPLEPARRKGRVFSHLCLTQSFLDVLLGQQT